MILVDDATPIWTLTISAEPRRNALTRAMVADLVATVDRFEADDTAAVLRLRGAGDAAFCAGADLKEMATDDNGRPFVPVMPALYVRVLRSTKPVIAVLNGDAVGGGFELALCCDVVLARSGARVGLPEARIGAAARYGAALLAREIGPHRALAMALFGDLIPIEEVPGVALQIVPAADLDAAADESAARLAELPRPSVVATKRLVRGSHELPLDELVELPEVLEAIHSDERHQAVGRYAPDPVK
jgi:enoyl-CoA hydratase/carnithine racemase